MRSYPTSERVTADLGDKVMEALSGTVWLAKKDLREYRTLRPAWVAAHSERGLASWIHDRHWYYLADKLSGVPGVGIVDTEPVRDFYVGLNYHLRVKRHHWDGSVSTYPTAAALEFMAQPPAQEPLDGLHEVHLLAGYSWDKETRDIVAPVLSLRDGLRKKTIWMIELPLSREDDGPATIPFPSSPEPTRPTIDTSMLPIDSEEEKTE